MSRDAFEDRARDRGAYPPPGYAPQSEGSGCFKQMLMGCGILALLGVLVVAIGIFLAYRWAKDSISQDPAIVAGWLQETVPSKIPDGYEGKVGVNMNLFGTNIRFIMIAPAGMQIDDEKDGRPDGTVFMLMSAPGMDQDTLQAQFEQQREQQAGGKDVRVKDRSTVKVKVGDREVKATKVEATENGRDIVEYHLMVKRGVLFVAAGPKDKFDQKAFDSFLGSMQVDPGDVVEIEAPEEEDMLEEEDDAPQDKAAKKQPGDDEAKEDPGASKEKSDAKADTSKPAPAKKPTDPKAKADEAPKKASKPADDESPKEEK